MPKTATSNQRLATGHDANPLIPNYYFLVTKSVDWRVKTSAQPAITVGFVHNVISTSSAAVFKPAVYARFMRRLYAALCAANNRVFNLLRAGFYPSSTGFITKTTIFKN
ncbi:MAG: hypothetical protein ACXWLH_01720 [Candidatus Saccharimonadales bacterium]